ncbi:uncharacterized protein LOC113766104 [Coffea eugenioides]|uniref:uncharacterized protein LOC113766104 n=1 Tax=Coffea eugenioides TaxID=49369 RepID=UPI000F6139AA|nr:uncharacterized protein LOC113766104 [Coffea eugenioides]
MNHIFLSCPVAIQSWALSHLSTKVHLDKARQVTIWLPTLRHQLPRKDVELVAVTLWNLWNNHNGVTFAGPYHDPLSLVSLSMNFLHQYRETISNPVHGSITSPQCQSTLPRWNKPQLDFVKANFDGVVFPSQGFSGVGVVVRDDAGNFIASLSKRILGILALDVVETYAVKYATQLLVELGYSHVVLEGDNLKIVKMLQQYESNDSACGIWSVMSCSFCDTLPSGKPCRYRVR